MLLDAIVLFGIVAVFLLYVCFPFQQVQVDSQWNIRVASAQLASTGRLAYFHCELPKVLLQLELIDYEQGIRHYAAAPDYKIQEEADQNHPMLDRFRSVSVQVVDVDFSH